MVFREKTAHGTTACRDYEAILSVVAMDSAFLSVGFPCKTNPLYASMPSEFPGAMSLEMGARRSAISEKLNPGGLITPLVRT